MAQTPRVLLYGSDWTLVELRGKVLGSSGFVTQVTDVSKEALELVRSKKFDLLILCHTLSDRACLEALEAAKEHPTLKRLVLTRGARNVPRSMFDGECSPLEGPECLIRETAKMLNMPSPIDAGTHGDQN